MLQEKKHGLNMNKGKHKLINKKCTFKMGEQKTRNYSGEK
jgi:hypothetical protein